MTARMLQVDFDFSRYEASHGKTPTFSTVGLWLFQIGDTIYEFSGMYVNCQGAIGELVDPSHADADGIVRVTVLP